MGRIGVLPPAAPLRSLTQHLLLPVHVELPLPYLTFPSQGWGHDRNRGGGVEGLWAQGRV